MKQLILILVLFVSVCSCCKTDKSASVEGTWITVPNNFSEYDGPRGEANWEYSSINLEGTKFKAGVGPWTFKNRDDTDYDYFGIDIEEPNEKGSLTIKELRVPLSYLSKEKLDSDPKSMAKSMVTFDKEKRTITYDLGNGIFVFKLDN